MSFRVAVASTDGKVINQHFGRSTQFLIFEISENNEPVLVETRENTPVCGGDGHHDSEMQRTINILSDCSKVLVSQIGPGAGQALKEQGITAYAVSDLIETALKKLIDYEHKIRKQ